ncbi:hypothetical protein KZZ10_05780 [Alcaligenaceae bacterium LF4-65]|uniref:Uncharacterized protein n=1 Tax=Zwartia hollandica TaxID=324606 RepID=A0A953T6U7_9BURK|nr:hypothetical protein [Zwartia hollandica]MBZ1350149.1 hypothetical protein [Zwartia hollandica]
MIQLLLNLAEKIDSQCRAYYRPLIILLCIFAFINFSRVGYTLSQNWNGWTIGDWILNYQGGFIRRGLLGTLLISVGNSFSMPLNDLTYLLQCTVFVLFLLTFIYLIRNKEINFWYLILCFSPGFLLFNYYDGMSVGRKEILIYMLFAAWCVLHERAQPRLISIAIFSILVFVLTLTHEMVLFFMPYFILVGYSSCAGNSSQGFVKLLMPAVASFAAVAVLILFAHPISEPSMCRIFTELGANEKVCNGIISFGSDASIGIVWQRLIALDPLIQLQWLAFLPLIVAPIYLCLHFVKHKELDGKKLLIIAAFLIMATAPLFLLSIDWGRWIAIHVTLSAIFIASHLPRLAQLSDERNAVANRMAWRLRVGQSNLIVLLTVGLAVLLLDLSYSINHCCANNLIEPFGPLKKLFMTLKPYVNF